MLLQPILTGLFCLTCDDWFDIMRAHASDCLLTHSACAHTAGLSKQKEAFLPFWITSATLRSQLHSAEVTGTADEAISELFTQDINTRSS